MLVKTFHIPTKLFTYFVKVRLIHNTVEKTLIIVSLDVSLRNTCLYFLYAFHSRPPFVLKPVGVAYSIDSLRLAFCHSILYIRAVKGEFCLSVKFLICILYNVKTNDLCAVCFYLPFKPPIIAYRGYLVPSLNVTYNNICLIIFLVLHLNYYGTN